MRVPNDVKLFLRDLCDPKLVVIKALYFCFLAGMVLLWPQFTIHQQHLGLTTYQTGVVSATMSGVGIIIPILSGFVGDKVGDYKKCLSVITILAGIVSCLFAVVPSARPTTTPTNTTTYITANTTALPEVDHEALSLTFWTYLVVRVTYGALVAVSYMLFEVAVMAQSQHDGVDYGFQRAWGTLGAIISSYLSGHIVQATGSFSLLFYISAGMQVLSAGLVLLVRLEFKLPAQRLTRDIITQVLHAEVIMFFVVMLASGVFFGYLETFMYRYLSSLGAPPILIGLTVTVGAPFELVLTLLTSFLVRHVGHPPIIMFGIFAHSVRLFGFSLLKDPWWVLPLEVLESVANGVQRTAAIMYCTELFTLQTLASFRGIYAVLYFGVGQLLGAMVGAEVREVLGDVITFRVLAGIALATSFTYCCAFYTMVRCRSGSTATFTPPDKPYTITHPEKLNTSTSSSNSACLSQEKAGIDNPACIDGNS